MTRRRPFLVPSFLENIFPVTPYSFTFTAPSTRLLTQEDGRRLQWVVIDMKGANSF